MRIYKYDIVFQEVPHHLSLAFYVCGCPLRCEGCHSPELWTEKAGYPLTPELFVSLLGKYQNLISCILFMGGEWHKETLIDFLRQARAAGLCTALYTGLEQVPADLESELDFLKTGPWKAKLGGLASHHTNQIFKDVTNNIVLNHLFQSPKQQQEQL